MVTRYNARKMPITHTSLVAVKNTIDIEPKIVSHALGIPHWYASMPEEIIAIHKNKTWILVPKTTDMNIVGSKRICKIKLKSDGIINKYKVRLVAK